MSFNYRTPSASDRQRLCTTTGFVSTIPQACTAIQVCTTDMDAQHNAAPRQKAAVVSWHVRTLGQNPLPSAGSDR